MLQANMKIAVLNRQGTGSGGATRAARRLVTGLSLRGHDAMMMSLAPGHDPAGLGIEPKPPTDAEGRLALRANELLQTGYIAPRRTTLSNTLFSAEIAGYRLVDAGLLETVDIVNIHWVPGFLAPHNLAEITRTGKPVVVTLHDMATFTGGCHYAAGCDGYLGACNPCLQVAPDVLALAAWVQDEKRRVLRAPNLVAVSPRSWLAGRAEASGAFGAGKVRVIPNGLDTEVFRPTPKPVAKSGLGIPTDTKTLLFGAENGRERRKGHDLLLDAVHRLQADARLGALLATGRVRVIAFGEAGEQLSTMGLPVQNLGVIRHDAHLALVYSAADLLVLPSREDNLPNILIESMACGTPAVAFATGGIPEVIDNDDSGLLIPPLDTAAMASAIAYLLSDANAAAAMGSAARRRTAERYALDCQAQAYESLFHDCLAAAAPGAARRQRSGDKLKPGVTNAPVTLHPAVARTALGLFIEQQARYEDLSAATASLRHELHRARDVLGAALRDAYASSSWLGTRWLRRGRHDPPDDPEAPVEELAVALLTLMRSKSWESTGWLRTLVRLSRAGIRGLMPKVVESPAPAPRADGPIAGAKTQDTVQIVLPASAKAPSAIEPQAQGELNVISLYLFHLELWEEFRTVLKSVVNRQTPLFVSLPAENAHFEAQLREEFGPDLLQCFLVENRGLDVLPFLQHLDQLKDAGIRPRTITKLHTKKSVHVSADAAQSWRADLYRDLVSHHDTVVGAFRGNPRLGMVCSQRWWLAEGPRDANYQAECRVIAEACALFDVPRSSHYLSGSMYTVSCAYLEKLFAGIDLDTYRASFPRGYRPSDTPAHAFERIVCYGLRKYGYQLGLF